MPDRQRELSSDGSPPDGGPLDRKRQFESLAYPVSDVSDEEALVLGELIRVRAGQILLEPTFVIRHPMDTHDHRVWPVAALESLTQSGDVPTTVSAEHGRFGWMRGHIHGDLPTTVVIEGLMDQLSVQG
jgi:hypothetical protein